MRSADRVDSVTMEDVALRAGVSRALVSIVFRGVPGASAATRERVMQTAEQLGYRPDQRARLLGSRRSRTIGVVFGLRHEFHTELVDQLYRKVDTSDYDLALGAATPARTETRAAQSLLDYRCEALILVGPSLTRAAIDELAERVPVVVVARAMRSRVFDVVRTDDVAGAVLAVEHLADLGHRSIAHVDGQRAPGATERRRGYRQAMRERSLESHIQFVPGGLTEDDGDHAAAQLQTASPPTAVTAFNDRCGVGLMTAARCLGLTVPGDLSIVGYDDSHIAGLPSIALTTIAQDAATLAGSALARALARAEDGRQEAIETVVMPTLVVRSSTSSPL